MLIFHCGPLKARRANIELIEGQLGVKCLLWSGETAIEHTRTLPVKRVPNRVGPLEFIL